MKRLKQLLAKGIDRLDEAEKAELMGMLAPEKLAEYSDAEIADLKGAVRVAADEMLDDDDNGDGTIEALESLANVLDAVTQEEDRRTVEKAEAEQRKQALRDRIRGAEETEEEPAAETDPEPEPEPEPAPEPEPEVVVAATAPARITRIRQRTEPPKPRKSDRIAPITAAAGLPGMHPGQVLDSDEKLFRAFDAATNLAKSANGEFTMPVISTHADIPQDRMLGRDAQENQQKIDQYGSIEALVASGGACAPVPYSYDLVTVGDDARPVRDACLRMGSQRAGASFFVPPTITDVSGTGATTSAVSEWTYNNDVTPSSPTTKPYLRIDCGSATAVVTRVNAIVTQYSSGNMMDRWYPELIQAYVKLIGVYHARFAEAKNLAAISALCKNVSHGQVLGSASDVFVALDQLITGIRYRHRIMAPLPIRVVGFEWVRKSIIADIIRRGKEGSQSFEQRLLMANEEVDGFFRAHNVNITWSPDFQFGRTITQTGGPFAGTQGVGPVIGYPSIARFYVWPEGSMIFLDGGELNIGVMRDVTLARTNDWNYFSETFENIAYNGVPGEAYTYDIDICANGATANGLDLAQCVSNS